MFRFLLFPVHNLSKEGLELLLLKPTGRAYISIAKGVSFCIQETKLSLDQEKTAGSEKCEHLGDNANVILPVLLG